MAGHVRKGRRVYMPPFVATGVLQIGNWAKDDLPDLLWPALVLAEKGNGSIRSFVRWQKAVLDSLSQYGDLGFIADNLDGRLTSLARLQGRFPNSVEMIRSEAEQLGLLSNKVKAALSIYRSMPAPWLTDNQSATPPKVSDLELIHAALYGVLADQHRESLIKYLPISSQVQAGTFRAKKEIIDLLKCYPNNAGTLSQADSVVRASWGATKSRTAEKYPQIVDDITAWAQEFWGANSMTSGCLRKRDLEEEAMPSDKNLPINDSDSLSSTVEETNLQRFAMDLLSSFIQALETSPTDLYYSERQEVVSGLVARAGRDVIAILGSPDLWSVEHAAHIGRMLVEIKIYIRWMNTQDLEIYKRFKDYGAGKAKLFAKMLQEVPDDVRTQGFDESVNEFQRLSHNDGIIDHRVVDTRDIFVEGKSLRKMAEETDLLDLYRHSYGIASGVSHSEWWSVETHAMEPCLNLLHGFHLIPSLSLNPGGNVELAQAWIDQLYGLIQDGLEILQPDQSAIKQAFAWLQDIDKEDNEDDLG